MTKVLISYDGEIHHCTIKQHLPSYSELLDGWKFPDAPQGPVLNVKNVTKF